MQSIHIVFDGTRMKVLDSMQFAKWKTVEFACDPGPVNPEITGDSSLPLTYSKPFYYFLPAICGLSSLEGFNFSLPAPGV